MDVCRVCLTEAGTERDITQLSEELKGDQKSCWDIMVFCLNIQVSPESKLPTKLCIQCFSKIIIYYQFKKLALKSDAYLHSVQYQEDVKCGKFEVANIKCEDMITDESDEDENVCEIEPICKIELVENGPKTGDKLAQNEPSKNDELLDDENEDDGTTDEEGNTESEDVVLSIIKKIKDQYGGETGKEKKKSAVKTKGKTKMVKVRRKKKPETCEECGKTVFRLFEHMKLHKPEGERKRFKCEICDKTFASYGARHTHNKIKHLGIKQHCDECEKEVVDLRNHRLVMHSAEELPFACAQCGRRFITSSKLHQHAVKHSDHRPHRCDVCDKHFQHHISLLQHKRRIHDQERTHLCQVCSRSFFSKYHLKLHIRSHTKEKPVECPDCGKGFISTVTMKSHQLIHSDTKDFACSFCDMAFKKPGYLRNHMKIHTKEKPYSCSFCDMSFARSDHRARHQRSAHAQPYAADDT